MYIREIKSPVVGVGLSTDIPGVTAMMMSSIPCKGMGEFEQYGDMPRHGWVVQGA